MKNELKEYEMTGEAGLYVGTYKKYNEGSLFGMWIDLEQFADAEDFFEVCRQLHGDESDPEFMFQDFQGFPEEFYHESMSVDDVQKILDYLQLSEDEREILDAYCECFGDDLTDFDDLLDKARERNCGKWDSFQQFADTQAEEMLDGFEAACKYEYTCKGAAGMVLELRKYFDYKAYARDLECDYYTSDSGYVFSAR